MSVAAFLATASAVALIAAAAVPRVVSRSPTLAVRTVAPTAPRPALSTSRRRRSIGIVGRLRTSAPIAIGIVASALLLGTTATAIVAVGGVTVHLTAPRRARKRLAQSVSTGYADVLELLVLTMHAGCLPLDAVRILQDVVPTPFDAAFAAVGRRTERGARQSEAMQALTDELGSIAAPLVQSLVAADRYGLPLAPVIDRLADEARAHRRRLADASARELPVRLSVPLVLCTLPSFVLVAIVPLVLGALSSLHL